ncbi:MAG TPA: glycosyl hydrolase, partial [Solirubrobacteraceae bacterium]|nr:glycosyl hydrolase [Solirubrobacteraceae bacterium]
MPTAPLATLGLLMRRLVPLIGLSVALVACGSAAPTRASSARDDSGSCERVELTRLTTTVSTGEVTLSWQLATSSGVRKFVIEQKRNGRWRSYGALPSSARSDTLTSLPRGPVTFRVLAVLKRSARRATPSAVATARADAKARRAAATQPGALAVGINAGYWGACEPFDLRTAVEYVRLDTPSNISAWTNAGLKVIADESGPYDSSGVSGLDAHAYVERVVAFVKANPQVWAVEVLNEPGGQWFWGASAESAANRTAYANLLVAVHDALVANFGDARPLILASYDGGHDSSNAWGEAWSQNATALADADMITEHPYGGVGERASASLGDRANVEAAYAKTHKPIAITEVGFPTKGPTGDSLKYTEAEQASSVAQIVAWARSTGYVKAITIYGYRDSGAEGGYGLQRHDGTKKPAWLALEQAALAAG